MTPPILLYDGTCGLCSRSVQIVLKRDREGRFRFAPLQGEFASRVLRRHGRDPAVLDTVVVVLDHGEASERILVKARAALRVLSDLSGPWALLRPLEWLPTPLLDLGYDLVARNRYRVFGRADACALATPEQRSRFLNAAGPDTDASHLPPNSSL